MALSDVYHRLFGKEHLKDGDVISLSEHGRSGGISTGQGFKFSKDVDEVTLIDEVSDTVTYIGKAAVGTATSVESWQIKKITISGTLTSIQYAFGSPEYSFEWDERANYTYS